MNDNDNDTPAAVPAPPTPETHTGRTIVGVLLILGLLAFIGSSFLLGGVQWDHIWYAFLAILLILNWLK